MDTDTKMRTNGHDFRFCADCGREYDALAGKCPFCAEGRQPTEFKPTEFESEASIIEAIDAIYQEPPFRGDECEKL